MKFGRNLPRNQVPEWEKAYIKYKPLKKLIKSSVTTNDSVHGLTSTAHTAARDQPQLSPGCPTTHSDTAEFFHFLDRNLEDVDSFYNRKFADAQRRLRHLQDRYDKELQNAASIDKEEAEDLLGALLELRTLLRKLQWYGEVNRRGFIKITKKLDKKVRPESHTQQRYMESKVDSRQFANNRDLTETMQAVNDWLSRLSELKVRDDASSTHSNLSANFARPSSMVKMPLDVLESLDRAIRADDVDALVGILQRQKVHSGTDQVDESLDKIMVTLVQRAISLRARKCLKEILTHLSSLDDEDDINQRNCIHRLVIAIGRSKLGHDDVAPFDGMNESQRPSLPPRVNSSDMRVNGINYLKPAAAPSLALPPSSHAEQDAVLDLAKDSQAISLFDYLIDNIQPPQQIALSAVDSSQRTPLHYAAQYGLVPIIRSTISHLEKWDLFLPSAAASAVSKRDESAVFQADVDGLSPLHLCVMGGHPETTETLLASCDLLTENIAGHQNPELRAKSQKDLRAAGDILALAARANYVAIVKLLLHAGVDVDFQDQQGETALHVAARFGRVEAAEALVKGMHDKRASLERAEYNFGWTPLHVACVDGQIEIVKVLIEAGTKLDQLDSSGWTALEHAALRGYIDVAKLVAQHKTLFETSSPSANQCVDKEQTNGPGPVSNKSLRERKSNIGVSGPGANGTIAEPVKTFGHRYLVKETMVLVSLGTMDIRKEVEAVNLDRIPLADAHSTQLDTALSVIVSASGASGEPSIIDLPTDDHISTEPVAFTTTDASAVKLLFDIVPTYAGSAEQIIGRAVALLSSIKPSIGSKRISLQGDVCAPILAAKTMDVIGSVNFNFLIITPFLHPNMAISEDLTYWKSMASTMVIGHRGLGKNSVDRTSLQLGENTLQSFIAASNLGASYVEFDVQLTKDLVPVIYHDFLVSETGIDAPMHTLTLEQFLHVSEGRSGGRARHSRQPDNGQDGPQSPNSSGRATRSSSTVRKTRSASLGAIPDFGDASLSDVRMKHTRAFKENGFKANSRGSSIQAPFTTLEEMFRTLPPNIGFNIEIKYPMLFESEEQEMDSYAVELNSFVDTILAKVYDFVAPQPLASSNGVSAADSGTDPSMPPTSPGGGSMHRNIIFSSFNPDICLLLSFKQPSIPVLFLTDAGCTPVGDIRASSLQEAVRFASRWNLLGIVSAASPFILAPRLVRVVKESGLVCVSYGAQNNEPANVRKQVREGIDAVIVDSVLAIRKGLTEEI